ncbi:MAG: flagellar export chaperone FliS [Firmicutes bacterium]|nr:flagellar export chaperone FliS [Bacillota bacterium]
MASRPNPYQSYRQAQVETADQRTLLLMLYGGALKFLRQGREAMLTGDIAETNRLLGRVQDILCELIGSLNPAVPDLAHNLFLLYEFMHHRLVQANVQKEPSYLDEVEQMLLTLQEAWQAALQQPQAAGSAI